MTSFVRSGGLFIAFAAFIVTTAACGSVPAVPAADQAPPVPVSAGQVDTRDWPDILEAGGVLRSRTIAVISSRLIAPVVAVHVRAGDRVSRGQVLVELDAAAARAEAAQAVASREAAELAVRAAEGDLAGARATVTLARATHERIRRLAESKSATAQELDEAVAGLATAEARVTAAEAGLQRATASLEAVRAGAVASDIVAGYGTLRSPIDGLVARRDVDPGTTATPGVPLLVLEDPTALRLEVDLDATRASGIVTGTVADVRIDGDVDPGWVEGRVLEVARLDSTTTTYRVVILASSRPTWRSGLFGRARFAGRARPTLTAPAAAILRRGQLTFVFVIGTDQVARLRAVRVGDERNDRVDVLAGITAGERVVVDPPAGLTDGQPVSVQAAAPGGTSR